jgi:predicted kinase
VLFDAIEFSPLIASGDVLYDLAFLMMDLTERGLRPAANIVLNRYLLATGRAEDFDGLATLPFYLSMRAAIRAKVTAARLQSSTAEKKDDIAKVARKYFDLARELIEPPPALLIAVGGLSGTGKSALARALAPGLGAAPGAVVLRSDIERKTLFGKDDHEKLPEDAYAPEVTAHVYATIADKARRAAAAGHCAIVDGVFAKPQERVVMERSARAVGVPFHGIFLDVDLATRVARVSGRSGDASDADAAVARAQESYDLGALDWVPVDASGNPDETLARARAAIERSTRSADTP